MLYVCLLSSHVLSRLGLVCIEDVIVQDKNTCLVLFTSSPGLQKKGERKERGRK